MPQPPSSEDVKRAALTWGPAFIGGFVWALARYGDQLGWLQDAYAKAFGPIAGLYENWTRVDSYGEALRAGLDEVRNPPRNAIDVATGTGFAAFEIARRFPSAQVTGVDVSKEMIGIAQHQCVADGIEIDLRIADSASLPFEDGEFDLAVVHNSIVHPEELMRVVSKGGRALVVYSFGGPWVALGWGPLAQRLEAAGAEYIWGARAGTGFFGVARR